jgi:hypothetical protein
MNPACVDLGYAELDPCVIYIGIYCSENTDCEGTLDLEYENTEPKRITIG